MASREKSPKFKKIFIVPHSHLDLSWLGTPAECEKINNGIIGAAVGLLETQPEFRFTVETVRPLELFLAENPGEKEKVARFFSEGRLEVGGMYVDVACDYCFDESLARNLAIGQYWLEKNLGKTTDIAREEDVSSHFAQAPQLLAGSGFAFLKLSRGPAGVFRWAAPNGTEIITALFEYNHSYHFRLGRNPELTLRNLPGYLRWMETQIKQPLDALMIMDGDDCTPPNPNLTAIVAAWNERTREPVVQIATARDFFEAISRDNLPSRRGDMPSFWIGVMLFELEAAQKLREAEPLITSAEKFSAGRFITGGPAPPSLEESWKLLLTAQDHNWGGKDETKNGARADADKVAMIESAIGGAREVLEAAVEGIISGSMEEHGSAAYAGRKVTLTVFNPLSWERDDVVNFDVPDDLCGADFRIVDGEGAESSVQLVADDEDSEKGIFIAEKVPPVGHKTFYIEKREGVRVEPTTTNRDNFIENDHYRLELCRGMNGLRRIHDKALSLDVAGMNPRGLLSAAGIELPFPALFALGGRFTTPPREYYENPKNLMKGGTGEGIKFLWKAWRPSQFRTREVVKTEGRVASVLAVSGVYMKCPVTHEFTVYNKIRRVDIRTTIDWRGEPGVFLAMLFPTPFRREEVRIGTPYFAHRMGDEAEGFWKIPGLPVQPKIRGIQHWFSMSDRRRTVTISSPWRAWDFSLMPTALLMGSDDRSGFFRHERYLQKGRRVWEFSLFSNAGDWKEGQSYRRGEEPVYPMFAVAGTGTHAGEEMSFCKVSPRNVILTCLKGADCGDGSVFARFYEVEGKAANVELEFPRKVARAAAADMLEREGKALDVRENKVICEIAPYEIGGLKVFF